MEVDLRKDRSAFVKILGDYPLIRVLDFLVTFRGLDYGRKQIANSSDVAWNTLEDFWPVLGKNKIVVKTRIIGRAQLYKLNEDSPIVKRLMQLDSAILGAALRSRRHAGPLRA